ncbi:MAG: endonuclease [Bacteroidales bacterium]|nr:endonuclease [Bacteroidales bacterium]
MRLFLWLVLMTFVLQARAEEKPFRVLFYNVENLFDCEKEAGKEDGEFLPTSVRRWGYRRFNEKLEHIAQVIISAGEWEPPVLVGLCEVENDSVLHWLTQRSSLRRQEYRYVMTHCADVRGIDVALLYRPERFRLLGYRSYPVVFQDTTIRPTRDLLHVTGLTLCCDTLDVLVAHLPSKVRSGSQEARLVALRQIKATIDSLHTVRRALHLLLMGDFNTDYKDADIKETLQTKTFEGSVSPDALYSLFPSSLPAETKGSYKYIDTWSLIDQIYANGLLLQSGVKAGTFRQAWIYAPDFLQEKDKKYGGTKPFRSWSGKKYTGGYSDHFPVCFDL